MNTRLSGTWLFALLSSSSALLAGPDWDEDLDGGQDAGSFTHDAQAIAGLGDVDSVSGTLNLLGPGQPDFEDVYLIFISDAQNFSAETFVPGGPLSDFNTQVWLFNFDGIGLLGNDDMFMDAAGIPNASNDGTGIALGTGDEGLYYLAISGFDNDPESGGGAIFLQVTPTEVSGNDGPGGGDPLSTWSGIGETGDYAIMLEGCSFVNTCLGDLNIDGTVNVIDLLMLLSSWGMSATSADLDNSGEVDVADLLILLGAWGVCFPV